MRGAELDLPRSHFAWRVVLSDDAKRSILHEPERFEGLAPSDSYFVDAYRRCGAADSLNRLLYIDYSYHLPDDLMIKNDRMTMAHSLEARVPYTDNELVAFLATVPVSQKMKGTRLKHLLRSAMANRLPLAVLTKKKVGLEMPYSRWLRDEWRAVAEAVLAESKLKSSGLFNPRGVRRLWAEHLARRADHGRALWGLINYLAWHEMYIEKGDYRKHLVTPRAPRGSDAVQDA